MKFGPEKHKSAEGFTLLELLIGMFIFSVIMLVIASIFSSSVFGYRGAKNIQQNLENAQYAISYIAKTLRTATIIKYTNSLGTTSLVNADGSVVAMDDLSNASSVVVWDYSKDKCLKFEFESASGQLKMWEGSGSYPDENNLTENLQACVSDEFSGSGNPVISNPVNGNFRIINTGLTAAGGQMGRITISIEVCTDAACLTSNRNKVVTESSVSLRDFNIIGR